MPWPVTVEVDPPVKSPVGETVSEGTPGGEIVVPEGGALPVWGSTPTNSKERSTEEEKMVKKQTVGIYTYF